MGFLVLTFVWWWRGRVKERVWFGVTRGEEREGVVDGRIIGEILIDVD